MNCQNDFTRADCCRCTDPRCIDRPQFVPAENQAETSEAIRRAFGLPEEKWSNYERNQQANQ